MVHCCKQEVLSWKQMSAKNEVTYTVYGKRQKNQFRHTHLTNNKK